MEHNRRDTSVEEKKTAPTRVLLIESARELRWALSRTCSERGWSLLTVSEGELQAMTLGNVDVVVIDVCPQGVANLRLLSEVHRRNAPSKLLAVTAYLSASLVVASVKAGATSCLCLPLYEPEFLRAIDDEAPIGAKAAAALPSLGLMQWEYITRVMDSHSGNISRAARVLGIQRSTLQRKLKKFPPTR